MRYKQKNQVRPIFTDHWPCYFVNSCLLTKCNFLVALHHEICNLHRWKNGGTNVTDIHLQIVLQLYYRFSVTLFSNTHSARWNVKKKMFFFSLKKISYRYKLSSLKITRFNYFKDKTSHYFSVTFLLILCNFCIIISNTKILYIFDITKLFYLLY